MKIPFNKPHFTGREVFHLSQSAMLGKLSGNGEYTHKCQELFQERYSITKALLTTSCSDALEMAALLSDIRPGDEVIMPSYTFVSTANAFALRGARIIFADSNELNPNIDAQSIESLITPATKVIVVVHYGGIACDMDVILEVAHKYNLKVVEDAAQAVDSFYKDKPLGTMGNFGAFSFHETKNITCGEGGMIAVNDAPKIKQAEIIWEKGTNRAAFARGEIEKYEWVALGSSFLPNELTAAFLFAQLEDLDKIQQRRLEIWNAYYSKLSALELSDHVGLPNVPDYARHNGHLFYLTTNSAEERDGLLQFLSEKGIHAVFHYLCLHSSPYFAALHDHRHLPHAERYSKTLLRLPFFYDLTNDEIDYIVASVGEYFKQ